MATVLALLAAACSPDSRLANAADDLENASDRYANGSDDHLEKIGNRVTPALERTIDRFDGNATSNRANAAESGRASNKN